MNKRRHGAIALLACAAMFLGGCAAIRSEIKVEAPAANAAPAVTQPRTVVIRSVKDYRVFAKAPIASVPSSVASGSDPASEAIKARAVARKRDGNGQAMGDVLLQEGQTVNGLLRDNLVIAFEQLGYRVTDAANAGPDPLLVDVRIRKFWSWAQPGFMKMTMKSDVEAGIHIVGTDVATSISMHAEESRPPLVTDAAWMEIVDKALLGFREQAVKKLGAPPFQ